VEEKRECAAGSKKVYKLKESTPPRWPEAVTDIRLFDESMKTAD
jgi:hypothetical protein